MRTATAPNPASKQSTRIAVLVLVTLMSATSFTFAGGIVAAVFGDALKPRLGFGLTWWQGALTGLVIGVPFGMFQARVLINRSTRVMDASLSLGLQLLADEDIRKLQSCD